jgi:hypothetical protein
VGELLDELGDPFVRIREVAARVPTLRAEPDPRFSGKRIRRMPSTLCSSSPDPSVDPSSTTMIS